MCLGYRCPNSDGADNVSVGVAFAGSYGRYLFRVSTNISAGDFANCPEFGVLGCLFPSLPLTEGLSDGEVADYVGYGAFEVSNGDFWGQLRRMS